MIQENNFDVFVEQFADIRILRYKINGFDQLSLERKKLLYYLSEAALAGRDILFDQNYKHNLLIRDVLEAIYSLVSTREDDKDLLLKLETYMKRVWFSSGIHHHYSTDKFIPEFSETDLRKWLMWLDEEVVRKWSSLPTGEFIDFIVSEIMDASVNAKRVCQAVDVDLVAASANNFYEGVTQDEAESFYNAKKEQDGDEPVSHGLNTRLVKENDVISEQTYKVDGKYHGAIKRIIYWLDKSREVAETDQQKLVIDLLINHYTTGDLKKFDEYSIAWLKEQEAMVDFINGFIEVYGDPLGMKGTWESLVNVLDKQETIKARLVSENAQWFEDHSPVAENHKKKKVQGVTMKVINAVMLGGDCYPATPIGINLPNADWIREKHGSKSVTLNNITESHHLASLKTGLIEEFAWDEAEVAKYKKHGALADNLHTHLHECVGHGSGSMLPGVKMEDLKAYGSVIEETRADLFGLYFMADEKMVELGLIPSLEVAEVQYSSYIRNGLMVQLARIKKGDNIEQAHMRNRQLICKWVYEKGQEKHVIEQRERDGKTYFVVTDQAQLRELFGALLKEVQRIKSEGDYLAAQKLVETYGVEVDRPLHDEVLERYSKLGLAPYTGFVNPVLAPVSDGEGNIVDVTASYSESFTDQMLRYSRDYHHLEAQRV
ncbi:dihydrofolate reductase [Marinilabiliaceae bacterium JC017]|nr:dihydrofolate reductase [Marinilabiliaceae bacterium JC017]